MPSDLYMPSLIWFTRMHQISLILCFLGCRGADKCYNRTLCEEHLNLILPAKPPFHPRQFRKCAVVGNSGDLLKTNFGKEIDSHDAVIRDNEAPVNEVICFPIINVCEVSAHIIFIFSTYTYTIPLQIWYIGFFFIGKMKILLNQVNR